MWFLGANKTIIIAICIVCGLVFGGSYLYNRGYDNGVQHVEQQVEQLNDQWKRRVDNVKQQYYQQIADLNIQHAIEIDKLQSQNKDLIKDNNKLNHTLNYYFGDKQNIKLDKNIVIWHDRAALGANLDHIVFEDVKGQYTLKDLMVTVADNYTNHNICYQKLTTLQQVVSQYIEQQKELVK